MSNIPLIWRLMRFLNQHVAIKNSPNLKGGGLVLVLYHTGRRSGQRHATPLQYEEIEGNYIVASARGKQADWVRNVLVNPQVEIQLRGECIPAQAEVVNDPERIAHFLQIRLDRHPGMMRLMLRLEGLHGRITYEDLLRVAQDKTLVILHPVG